MSLKNSGITKPKSNRGGKRSYQPGPMKGRKLKAVTKARIAATIDTQNVIRHLNMFMSGEMHEPSQVTAAKILLDRVMPTLAATELSGKDGEPVQFVFEKVE